MKVSCLKPQAVCHPCIPQRSFLTSLSSAKYVGLAILLASLSACQPSNEATQSPITASNQSATKPSSQVKNQATVQQTTNHLTLYTSIDKQDLQPLLDAFTKQTEIVVTLVSDQPMSLLARLKAEGENSPADVILTQDVGVFQQAVEASLLQPFSSGKTMSNVPERYKDPNGNWLALSYYGRTAVYNSLKLTADDISSYADLAKPKWYQKLCLSQGKYPPNQSLTVNLIDNLGDKKATEVLQGWMVNLAMPPVLDDIALMQAIDSGKCELGLVNSDTYAKYLQQHPRTPIKLTWINKGYGGVHTNVTGIAITHMSKHPELALNFIEWLADKEQQSQYASLSKTFPINATNEASVLLQSWGEIEANPIPVRKYADQQKIAVDVMEKAGYY